MKRRHPEPARKTSARQTQNVEESRAYRMKEKKESMRENFDEKKQFKLNYKS